MVLAEVTLRREAFPSWSQISVVSIWSINELKKKLIKELILIKELLN